MKTTQVSHQESIHTLTEQSVRTAVRVKFNRTFEWACSSWLALSQHIATQPATAVRQCIRELTICNPRADDARFLVTAHQELMCILTEWDLVIGPKLQSIKGIHLEKVEGDLSLKKEKRSATELARVYEALFHEAKDIARHNLFGVAGDPVICKLRLENELLSFAHDPAVDKEALPDLSLNIRQGNPLLRRFQLTTDLKKMLKGNTTRLGLYLTAIRLFKEAKTPVAREEAWAMYTDMHKNFYTHHRRTDPDYLRLKQLEYRLSLKSNPLFPQEVLSSTTDKAHRVIQQISRLKEKIEEAAIRQPLFEWRYAFPEVLSSTDGKFEGFDLVLVIAPEEKGIDTVSPWMELATEITNGQLAMVLPDDFFRSKRYRLTNRTLLRDFDVTGLEEIEGDDFEADSTGKLLVRLAGN